MSEITKIQPVELCGAVGKCMASPASYVDSLSSSYRKPSSKEAAAHALRQLEAAREKDLATHAANLPAMEINKVIAARIETLMTEVGIPKSFRDRDLKSRARNPVYFTCPAGWVGDVQRNCRTDDGFDAATRAYERILTEYKAYAARAEKEAGELESKRQREQADLIEKRKADMELASILLRYALPIESSWSDALEALRSKDQRLDLAVAMEQTRGDWSDGPYRVKNALDRFNIETTEDKDIANDVLSCLEDFDDGRVFRDTTWSYGALYASIKDAQLLVDVKTAMSHNEE